MAYPSKLTPKSILHAALPLVESDGADTLNMRTLAVRLGVQASSLYRHYPDRAALLLAIEEQTTLALHTVMANATEGVKHPAARLSAAAQAYLTYATEHPHLYALLLAPRPPTVATPGSGKNLWNLVLQLVGDVSGNPDDTARTVVLWAYLHGFALLTLSGLLGLSGDQGGFQVGVDTLINGFEAAKKRAEPNDSITPPC
ncbi:TetR/AcrR family transcriptional regulator (plasmid) [Deinococcus sp. KNUC1210]|uniref:TetR/AcrR family transcriptional regulator n=1 Tax=Deinococcus sp. KNUC1210 TaxID=2917691 RepID=UPI001EF032C5|nr:TetR/AcrR family transcriptional regulator [Deinococcus sp. KNUC1210]ULH14001.1 TetR/AcrR family transcriptional regulator [Deinococcus sp. KNUC1210]